MSGLFIPIQVLSRSSRFYTSLDFIHSRKGLMSATSREARSLACRRKALKMFFLVPRNFRAPGLALRCCLIILASTHVAHCRYRQGRPERRRSQSKSKQLLKRTPIVGWHIRAIGKSFPANFSSTLRRIFPDSTSCVSFVHDPTSKS
jgi:hypothetical protein